MLQLLPSAVCRTAGCIWRGVGCCALGSAGLTWLKCVLVRSPPTKSRQLNSKRLFSSPKLLSSLEERSVAWALQPVSHADRGWAPLFWEAFALRSKIRWEEELFVVFLYCKYSSYCDEAIRHQPYKGVWKSWWITALEQLCKKNF